MACALEVAVEPVLVLPAVRRFDPFFRRPFKNVEVRGWGVQGVRIRETLAFVRQKLCVGQNFY